MSMGLLTGDDTPMVLRGPMVSKYLRMFIGSVAWPPLDLPPGSGDTQLTLAQSVPLSGAVIVTTPQEVSLKITRRGIRMFEKVHVPILGIVENMSTFVCPHCGETTDIFQHGGGERMSQQLGVPFLGAIPINADIVTVGDAGLPIVTDQPGSTIAFAYTCIAQASAQFLKGRRLRRLQVGMTRKSVRRCRCCWTEKRTRQLPHMVGRSLIVDVTDRNLYVEMSGGCQGCASSHATLRQGFERMVRRIAPELINIVDVTDHAAGTKPFYRQANAWRNAPKERQFGKDHDGAAGYDGPTHPQRCRSIIWTCSMKANSIMYPEASNPILDSHCE